ncbi:MAG: hypothetical protein LBH75_08020 [Treponema sp.]|jgi:aspartate ammonia-lyase|nr:hypothetical protein [Treponema sp.]
MRKTCPDDAVFGIQSARAVPLTIFSHADALLESLTLLERTLFLFRTECVDTLTADTEQCKKLFYSSLPFADAFVPPLGYDQVSRVVMEHGGNAEQFWLK